jgi:hypothetical protein
VLVTAVALALAGAGLRLVPAWAAGWTDSSQVSSGTFTAGTVPTPGNFDCTAAASGFTFSWSSVPSATSYLLTYTGGSHSLPAGTTSYQLPPSLLGLLGSGTAHVTANVNFGSTIWTSAPSPNISYSFIAVVLGLFVGATC